MSPEAFATRCQEIVSTMRGHEAHRALDLLTNDVLRAAGYGDGIAVFEAAVAHWHASADPYPYTGPCPDCDSGRLPKGEDAKRSEAAECEASQSGARQRNRPTIPVPTPVITLPEPTEFIMKATEADWRKRMIEKFGPDFEEIEW